jgi:hypothetical protein
MSFAVVRALFLVLVLPLAACGAKSIVASDVEVQRAVYRAEGPTTLTLYTMIANRNGEGGHSALMVNGSQRVLFDPAGSWHQPTVPERNDVLFGMTPTMEKYYRDYHARETFHLVIQTLQVSPEVAEQALRDVQAYGAVPQAFCAHSTSKILRGLPGFGDLDGTMFPAKLMRRFAEIPGVVTETQYDTDSDNNAYKLAEAAAAIAAEANAGATAVPAN